MTSAKFLTTLRLAALPLAVMVAVAAVSAPAAAQQPGSAQTVNGFERLPPRAPLPGERAAGLAQAAPALPGTDTALALQQSRDAAEDDQPVRFSMTGTRMMGGRTTGARADHYLGDGVAVYDSRGIETGPYYGFGYGQTPHMAYNESYLRYRYNGNIAGVPSVSAPSTLWRD